MPPDGQFYLTLPAYTLLLKDGSGAMCLQCGPDVFLPLFTDRDNVNSFLARAGIRECVVRELPTPQAVADYFRNPPHRGGGRMDIRYVMIDPRDPEPGTVATLLTVEQFLASVPA